jgi:hypothetical protein
VELAALREEDFALDLIGFEDQELAHLLSDEDGVDGLKDEDAVPEILETPITRPRMARILKVTE